MLLILNCIESLRIPVQERVGKATQNRYCTRYSADLAREEYPHHVSAGISTGVFHKSKAGNSSQSVRRKASRCEYIIFEMNSLRSIACSRRRMCLVREMLVVFPKRAAT